MIVGTVPICVLLQKKAEFNSVTLASAYSDCDCIRNQDY